MTKVNSLFEGETVELLGKVSKSLLGFVALVTAVITIIAWTPQARDLIFPKLSKYATLQSLQAGQDIDYFSAQLGQPVLDRTISREAEIREAIFRDEDYQYIVTAYYQFESEVIFYSVTTLDKGFRPKRTLGMDEQFQLNTKSMQDRFTQYKTTADGNPSSPDPQVFYSGGWTGSTPELVVEPGPGTGSNADMRRSHFTGINLSVPYMLKGGEVIQYDPPYEGPLGELPEQWKDFRTRASPNFYAEGIGYNWYMSGSGSLMAIEFDSVQFDRDMRFTPHHYDLPIFTQSEKS